MRRFSEKSPRYDKQCALSSAPDDALLGSRRRCTVIVVTHHTSAINQLSSIGREIDGVKPHTCHSRQRRPQISNNDTYPVHLLEVLSTADEAAPL